MNIDKQEILKDISIEITPGQTIGIFGPSGSGKVFFNLSGYKAPKTNIGNIFLGDDNFNKIDNKSLRSKIGFVSQDISLFHGTIIENVILSENKNNKNLGKIKNNIKKF